MNESDVFDPSDCTLPDIRDVGLYQKKRMLLMYFVMFVIICVLILVSNGIVLWAFVTNVKLRSRKYILIFSLCFTDLFTGCVMPFQIFGPPSVVDGLSVAFLQISIFTNLAIAVDRFYMLVIRAKKPSSGGATRKQLVSYCVLIWIGTISFILPWTLYPYYYTLLLYTFAPWSVVITMISVSCLYAAIFYTMRKMDKRKQKRLGKGDFKRTKLVVRAYAVIVVVFGACWLPWCFEAILISVEYYFKSNHCYMATNTAVFLLNLGLLNSAINPLIYWRKLPDFRYAINNLPIFRVFTCCACCKKTPENNTVEIRNTRVKTVEAATYDGHTVELE